MAKVVKVIKDETITLKCGGYSVEMKFKNGNFVDIYTYSGWKTGESAKALFIELGKLLSAPPPLEDREK